MSAAIAAWGRIGQEPRRLDTRTGTPMAVGSLAVDLGDQREGSDGAPLWLGIVAFGDRAEQLLRHAKGDCLSVAGRLQVRRYRASDGAEREQLQVVADSIVSARTVRPGGGKKREAGDPRQAARELQAPVDPELDDRVPW